MEGDHQEVTSQSHDPKERVCRRPAAGQDFKVRVFPSQVGQQPSETFSFSQRNLNLNNGRTKDRTTTEELPHSSKLRCPKDVLFLNACLIPLKSGFVAVRRLYNAAGSVRTDSFRQVFCPL